jgi:hypothetical protein
VVCISRDTVIGNVFVAVFPRTSVTVSCTSLRPNAVGVPHIVVPQRRDRIAAESEKNGLTSFCADEHAQFLPLRDYFAANRCAVFDGLAVAG